MPDPITPENETWQKELAELKAQVQALKTALEQTPKTPDNLADLLASLQATQAELATLKEQATQGAKAESLVANLEAKLTTLQAELTSMQSRLPKSDAGDPASQNPPKPRKQRVWV